MLDHLSALGFDAARSAELVALGDQLVPARVTRVDRGAVTVATATEERRLPADDLAVGDWVALDGDLVAARLERRSALVRDAGDTTRLATARFYAEHYLARAPGYLPGVEDGGAVAAFDPDRL